MDLFQLFLVQLPLVVLFSSCLVLLVLALKLRQITGEDSITHLMTLFFFAASLFLSVLVSSLVEDNPDLQYWFLTVGIFMFWFLMLEMGIFYLTVFVNPNSVLPSARLYIPAILGAATTMSSVKVLENFGKGWEDYRLGFWELVIYVVAMCLVLVMVTILTYQLKEARKWYRDRPNALHFLDGVREIIMVGAGLLFLVFFSVLGWFNLKTTESVLRFSFEVSHFAMVDWLLWLQLPVHSLGFLFIIYRMLGLLRVAKDLDLSEMYNTIA